MEEVGRFFARIASWWSWNWTNTASDIAVMIASLAALWGIGEWRRESRGRRRIELAEEALALFNEARDAIRWIRSPMGYSSEQEARVPEEGETEAQRSARNRAYPTLKRFNDNAEVFAKLWALRYRFPAYFGSETVELFTRLKKVMDRIIRAAQSLADLWADPDLMRRHDDMVRDYETTIWGVSQDEIAQEVEAIVAEVEQVCGPVLS